MSDDPRVTVPAELVERWERDAEKYAAMGEGRSASHKQCRQIAKTLGDCAAELRAALVDAAERPDDGHVWSESGRSTFCRTQGVQTHIDDGECSGCGASVAPPPVPVSDYECQCNGCKDRRVNGPYNVCKCGHREAWHNTPHRPNCTGQFGRCPCLVFEFDHVWPVPVSDEAESEPCPHTCLLISDEDYQRSEGVCDECGVRMKNDAKTGWGPLLPFGDVPCGSRVGECCPPHKFTNEGAPDVCDTCGDSEHPPVSDEAEAWAEWSADTFEYDGTIAHQAFIAGFRAARLTPDTEGETDE